MVQFDQGGSVKTLQPRMSRRHFLLAATAATATGGAAVAARKDAIVSSEVPSASSKGAYQVTEHVRAYYRTARI